jgi:hypothetical protein
VDGCSGLPDAGGQGQIGTGHDRFQDQAGSFRQDELPSRFDCRKHPGLRGKGQVADSRTKIAREGKSSIRLENLIVELLDPGRQDFSSNHAGL